MPPRTLPSRPGSMIAALILWGVVVLNSTLIAAQTERPNNRPNGLSELLDESRLKQLTLSQLETRLSRIDSLLEELAKPSMQMGEGAVGYRSAPFESPNSPQSIQIELDGEQTIDQVILVPAIWRDTQSGFRADGFPLEFQVFAGSAGNQTGELIASYTEQDNLLPRVAPLIISCPNIEAAWVRIEVTRLSRWAWDDRPILQLSEIMVFNKQRNVALRQPVDLTSDDGFPASARYKQYLVDGFVPYVMDAQRGKQSIAFVSLFGIQNQPNLTIDLESVHPLDQIHLHSADLSDTVPQSVPSDFGVPERLVVEGAMSPDFSDAVTLVEYEKKTVYDAGPIVMRQFPATDCRYVRLVALEPYTRTKRGVKGSQIGFAEIELFAKGRNVALGKKVTSKLSADSPDRLKAAITDGNNLYGQILPIRTWLGQLALRHDLEVHRPRIAAELNQRYVRQRTYMKWLSWLAGGLAAAAIAAVLVGKNLRERAVLKTREQIAADLHDELGANCHAIGLLSDLAQASSDSPEKLNPLMIRIRELTQRTGMAATYCANMLESEGLFDALDQDMRRSAERLMADLQHSITLSGEEFLNRLNPRKRIGVLLFYKECLTNIIRHSGATKVVTELVADANKLSLNITDNGHGLPDSTNNCVPGSLKRRARLLGAKVFAHRPAAGGTRIELTLHTRQPGILRIFSGNNA